MPENITNYDGLVDLVRLDVPGAEVGAILLALRQAGRDFCIRSEIWYNTETFDSVTDQASYPLSYSNNTYPHRIISFKFRDVEVDSSSYTLDDGNIVFEDGYESQEDVTDGYVCKYVVVPKLNQNDILANILEVYGDAIASGAKAILARSPKKPYTDQNIMSIHQHLFNDGITRAKQQRKRAGRLIIPSWGA
jgi:hypothetical protein